MVASWTIQICNLDTQLFVVFAAHNEGLNYSTKLSFQRLLPYTLPTYFGKSNTSYSKLQNQFANHAPIARSKNRNHTLLPNHEQMPLNFH